MPMSPVTAENSRQRPPSPGLSLTPLAPLLDLASEAVTGTTGPALTAPLSAAVAQMVGTAQKALEGFVTRVREIVPGLESVGVHVAPGDTTGLFHMAGLNGDQMMVGLGTDPATAQRRYQALNICAAHELGHRVDKLRNIAEGVIADEYSTVQAVRKAASPEEWNKGELFEDALMEMTVDGIGAKINLEAGVLDPEVGSPQGRLYHMAQGLVATSQEAEPTQSSYWADISIALRTYARATALLSLAKDLGGGEGITALVTGVGRRAQENLQRIEERYDRPMDPALTADIVAAFSRAYQTGFAVDVRSPDRMDPSNQLDQLVNRSEQILRGPFPAEEIATQAHFFFATGQSLPDQQLIELCTDFILRASQMDDRAAELLPVAVTVLDGVRLRGGSPLLPAVRDRIQKSQSGA